MDRQRRRPLLVTLLALGVLCFTVQHITRFIMGIQQWDFVSNTVSVSVAIYIVLTGFIWTGFSIPIMPGLWRGKYSAHRLTLWITIAFTLYYWIDRLIVSRSTSDQTNVVFSIIINFLALITVTWITNRKDTKVFFGDMHD